MPCHDIVEAAVQGQTLSSGELVEGVVVGDPVFCGKKVSTTCWLLQRPRPARCLTSELSPPVCVICC